MVNQTPERTTPGPPPGNNSGEKMIPLSQLPPGFRGIIVNVPPEDWGFAEAILCHLPFIRGMVEVIRYADVIWRNAQNAEHRNGHDRVKGAEMDVYRDRVEKGLKEIVDACVELRRRGNLVQQIDVKHHKVLRRYGHQALTHKKSQRPRIQGQPQTAARKTPADFKKAV